MLGLAAPRVLVLDHTTLILARSNQLAGNGVAFLDRIFKSVAHYFTIYRPKE